MKQIGKITVFFVLFALLGASGAFAQKLAVTGQAPQVTISGVPSAAVTLLNNEIKKVWDDALNKINNDIGGIDSKPEKLIRGFADASVFASQGATQRGYGEPRLFTVTIGSMIGVKIAPGLGAVGDFISNITDEFDKVKDDGDIKLGINVQALSGQFNLNTSRWLVDGLDLGFRFGLMRLDNLIDGFGSNTWSLGAVGNYQILKEKTLVPVLVKWRGLSLGTGVIYQNTKLSYGMALDATTAHGDSQTIGGYPVIPVVNIEPELDFDMTTATITIPVEATTAIQLFSFLNLTLGAGVDIAFGKNDMSLGLSGDVTLNGLDILQPLGVSQIPGNFNVDGGGTMAPTVFNPKIMTGVGFKMGPVILDIPITYYFLDGTGLNAGVTLGFTW